MRRRVFISIGIIILIVAVGFLYTRQKFFNANMSNEMKIYRDQLYRFHISYPSYLTPVVSDTGTGREVTFVSEGDPWTIAIAISTTTAVSARAWVEEYNQKNYSGFPPRTTRYRIEREIVISETPAVIVHPYSDFQGQHEEYQYDKSALIVRDGKLFTIGARTADPDKVWDGFRLDK